MYIYGGFVCLKILVLYQRIPHIALYALLIHIMVTRKKFVLFEILYVLKLLLFILRYFSTYLSICYLYWDLNFEPSISAHLLLTT